jgi:N-acetylmuramoyl-L-alanine amidase
MKFKILILCCGLLGMCTAFASSQTIITAPQEKHTHNIVIDPGHGGKDPGATGVHGTHEKNVVLAISKYLQCDLNSHPGFHVVLTRNSDYFIPLTERLQIARNNHADLFVAIHADAYPNPNSHGATVFALSMNGATSVAAHWIAKQENESELGHMLYHKDRTLRSVLIDLTQTASITTSLEVGKLMIQNLDNITRLHHPIVEQAGFLVLKAPEIPSLLVETGFLSNAGEELKLRDPAYQQEIANALANGIIKYYQK